MLFKLFGNWLRKRPLPVQALFFGLALGICLMAFVEANDNEPSWAIIVAVTLVFGVITGTAYYLASRATLDREWLLAESGRPGEAPLWVLLAWTATWFVGIAALLRNIIDGGSSRVGLAVILPIVLVAPLAKGAIGDRRSRPSR